MKIKRNIAITGTILLMRQSTAGEIVITGSFAIIGAYTVIRLGFLLIVYFLGSSEIIAHLAK